MRILLAERASANKARTASINQIHALLVSASEAVHQDFRRFDGAKLAVTLARTRPAPGTTPELIARASAKRPAQRQQALTADIAHIDHQLRLLAIRQKPALLAANGVGPFVAAHLLATAGDNPNRITAKAQFAALCGVAPIPASSGTRQRFRLSRGGDPQANAALRRSILLRKRHKKPRTTAYIARRTIEGLSDRDTVCCLKRHIANGYSHCLPRIPPARYLSDRGFDNAVKPSASSSPRRPNNSTSPTSAYADSRLDNVLTSIWKSPSTHGSTTKRNTPIRHKKSLDTNRSIPSKDATITPPAVQRACRFSTSPARPDARIRVRCSRPCERRCSRSHTQRDVQASARRYEYSSLKDPRVARVRVAVGAAILRETDSENVAWPGLRRSPVR